MSTPQNIPENAADTPGTAPASSDGGSVGPGNRSFTASKPTRFVKRRKAKQRGRRTLLTDTLQKKICANLRKGASLTIAAQAEGIAASTASNWYSRGCDESDGLYYEFACAVDVASAKGDMTCVKRIDDAGRKGKWEADWKRLSCRHKEYREPKHVEHSGQVNHAHVHAVSYVDTSVLSSGALAGFLSTLGQVMATPESAGAIETEAKRIDAPAS